MEVPPAEMSAAVDRLPSCPPGSEGRTDVADAGISTRCEVDTATPVDAPCWAEIAGAMGTANRTPAGKVPLAVLDATVTGTAGTRGLAVVTGTRVADLAAPRTALACVVAAGALTRRT